MNFTKPKTKRYNAGTKNKLNEKNHICKLPQTSQNNCSESISVTEATHSIHQSYSRHSLMGNMIFCAKPKTKCAKCSN